MRPRARSVVATLALGLSATFTACSFEWNDNAPGLALTGTAPPLESLHLLSRATSGLASLVTAPDGSPWAAFCEFWSSGSGSSGRACKKLHVVQLAGGSGDETIDADSFEVRATALYVIHDDTASATRTIAIHRPGQPSTSDATFSLPLAAGGGMLLYVAQGGDDAEFVYWPLDPATKSYATHRAGTSFVLSLPVPPGVDPAKPASAPGFDFVLTASGNTLVVRTPDGAMSAFSTLDGSQVALGMRPASFLIDDAHGAVLTSGDGALRSVPLDGSAEKTLIPRDVDLATLHSPDGNLAYVSDDTDLYRCTLDGTGGYSLFQAGAARVLAFGASPDGTPLAYTHQTSLVYAGGAGDGFISGWQFMERGRKVRESGDGKRIHFLEHAAQTGTVGDLTSVPLVARFDGSVAAQPEVLALNAHAYDELADGRLVAIENHAFAGSWNRLVIIDEAAQTKRWLVPSAAEFFVVPGGRSVVADVVSGASGYEIYEAPIPDATSPE